LAVSHNVIQHAFSKIFVGYVHVDAARYNFDSVSQYRLCFNVVRLFSLNFHRIVNKNSISSMKLIIYVRMQHIPEL
jgi:hypothetical protein